MARIQLVLAALCVVCLPASHSLVEAAEKSVRPKNKRITLVEFRKLHSKLTKMGTERVWSIPWQLSVRKARELAAQQKRPVFLWISSNGGTHPLGPC